MSKRLTRRICLARAALIKHLLDGGTFSIAWPNYVAGVPKNLGRRERARAVAAVDAFLCIHLNKSLRDLTLYNFYEASYSAHHYDNGRST